MELRPNMKERAVAAGFLDGANICVLQECDLPHHVMAVHHEDIEIGRQEGREARRALILGNRDGFDARVARNKALVGLV